MPIPSHTLLATSKDRDKPLAKWDKLLRSARHWYRADTVTRNGNNLRTVPNRGVAGGVLNVSFGTIPAPSATLGEAPALNIDGATGYLQASHVASEFRFLHNALGCELFFVGAFTENAAIQFILSTFAASAEGACLLINAGISGQAVTRNSSVLIGVNAFGATVPAATPSVFNFFHKTTQPLQWSLIRNNFAAISGNYSSAPTNTGPAFPLTIGAKPDNTLPAIFTFGEVLLFDRVLTPYERQTVREYIQARYGIAAPVYTTEDKEVLKLNPRHWYRADTNMLSGANLASLSNRGSAGGQLGVAAGTIAAPSVDASLGNAQSIILSGTQYLTSSLNKSEFRFLHDGSGCDIFAVVVPTDLAVNSAIVATRGGGSNVDIGIHFRFESTTINVLIFNGVANVASAPVLPVVAAQPICVEESYKETESPVVFIGVKDAMASTVSSVRVPSAADPDGTLHVGRHVTVPALGKFRLADLLIFDRRLLPYERQTVREYIQARYGIAAPVYTAEDKLILQMNPRHWYRADTNMLNGANLAALPNKGSAISQLNVTAGTLLAPTDNPLINNAKSVNFTQTQYLDSNLPKSEFKFLHDGTGLDLFDILGTTGAAGGTQTLWATRIGSLTTEIGMARQLSSGGNRYVVLNGTATAPCAITTLAFSEASPTYGEFTHSSVSIPNAAGSTKDIFAAATYAAALSVADPDGTFRLGAMVGGTQKVIGQWAETIIFNRVLTPYERQQVREYIQTRYAIAAPVYTTEEREVLKLNPYSWIRVDNYIEASGKVTSFIDKVRPGHSMAQATPANQVATPVADSAFNNKLSATFIAANATRYVSNLPATAWAFAHLGTGIHAFTILIVPVVQTTAAVMWSTKDTATASSGVRFRINTVGPESYGHEVGNAAGLIVNAVPNGSPVPHIGFYQSFSYKTGLVPEWSDATNGIVRLSGIASGAPGGTNLNPLILGGNPPATGQYISGRFADLIIFDRVLSEFEIAIVKSYIARYGL